MENLEGKFNAPESIPEPEEGVRKDEVSGESLLETAEDKVINGSAEAKPKSRDELSFEIMAMNQNDLGPETKILLGKYQRGEKLSQKERNRLGAVRNEWWRAKIGSKFKTWRGKPTEGFVMDLRRKGIMTVFNIEGDKKETFLNEDQSFNDQESNQESYLIKDFQKEFFKKNGWDKESLNSLKGYLISKYPDSVEEVQVVVGIIQHTQTQLKVDLLKEQKQYTYDPEVNKNFAEYNFLLEHFFVAQPLLTSDAKELWHTLETVARKLGAERQLKMLQTGIMGQVAIYKILKALGQKPKFSKPSDDVYYKIDIWSEKGTEDSAYQIKVSKNTGKDVIMFQKSDIIDFPSVSQKLGYKENHFIYENLKYISHFPAYLEKYREKTGKDIDAWYVVLPKKSFDKFTGEPKPYIIEEFKNKMRGIGMEDKQEKLVA